MSFNTEAEFEKALITALTNKGWEKDVIYYPTEKDLIHNWKQILFANNSGIDRLNNCPLTDTEMQQIMEQITTLRTPLKLNGFINGKTISIKRDNPNDSRHCGKEISLKIYDRCEIAAGQSRYQIVSQPQFPTKSKILNDRRGDVMLLINGMPVIHIELKKSGIQVSHAYNQIEKYAAEGIFTGLFSLVQLFVAMNPVETVYFANPGPDGNFNSNYYFHWADFDNEPINKWEDIVTSLLSIPMAHQLIGFYTVADKSDGVLKVMRSYQYYAANAISDKVSKIKWNIQKQTSEQEKQLGGFVWHTTGSGKTMTSFKSAQLIANSGDADKVVFLTDRIELGIQSFDEYNSFADESESVQKTENTGVLISKLKSTHALDTLIVTSIQKMSNIKNEDGGLNQHDIDVICSKRLVFIVDEAHRSTFGDMLLTIKSTFPNAIFFGFTGTPIHEENRKKGTMTLDVFGSELHRYSIADGIRDKNVLGFDPCRAATYKDSDVREVVALEKAKAKTQQEALSDPDKAKVYYEYINNVAMAGHKDANGDYIKGIEDFIPEAQYETSEHQNKVVEDIASNWAKLSRNSKFHAIFATSSIPEAIEYYRLIKNKIPTLKTTCLFDPNIDNNGNALFKETGLVEILTDYNKRYQQDFTLATHGAFKKDLSLRLAHKKPYERIENDSENQLDLLIVVDQMLTGFDSKWLNTLYLDKVLEYENIIQAFSRTNRLFGQDKPFGTIRYYRRPYTMQNNIEAAVELYSGNKPLGLFVNKLPSNLNGMNAVFTQINDIFTQANVINFQKLPQSIEDSAKFALLYRDFNEYLEAAKIQGFVWDVSEYSFTDEVTGTVTKVTLNFDETKYLTLAQRYKELSSKSQSASAGNSGNSGGDIPFDLVGYLTQIDTGKIDNAYMNSKFTKYHSLLQQTAAPKLIEQALEELCKTFAVLTQEEQKFANVFLGDVQRGNITVVKGKSFRDYITEYQCKAKDAQIHTFAKTFGLDEAKLRTLMSLNRTASNINEFGHFDKLYDTVEISKATAYFERIKNTALDIPEVHVEMDELLRDFILQGGFDLL